VANPEIDLHKIGEGRTGPITRKLPQVFQQTVKGKHARSVGWLLPVQASESRGPASAAGPRVSGMDLWDRVGSSPLFWALDVGGVRV
jgi:hypothetical protein